MSLKEKCIMFVTMEFFGFNLTRSYGGQSGTYGDRKLKISLITCSFVKTG